MGVGFCFKWKKCFLMCFVRFDRSKGRCILSNIFVGLSVDKTVSDAEMSQPATRELNKNCRLSAACTRLSVQFTVKVQLHFAFSHGCAPADMAETYASWSCFSDTAKLRHSIMLTPAMVSRLGAAMTASQVSKLQHSILGRHSFGLIASRRGKLITTALRTSFSLGLSQEATFLDTVSPFGAMVFDPTDQSSCGALFLDAL
jgi:hypothetical protein